MTGIEFCRETGVAGHGGSGLNVSPVLPAIPSKMSRKCETIRHVNIEDAAA
jgi:hypothetical protein